MPVHVWAAEDVEEKRRFDYYRTGLCASFVRLSPERHDRSVPFNARLRLLESGSHSITTLTVPRHEVLRTPKDIALAEDDFVYLNIILAGEMCFKQGEAASRLSVGDMVVIDNARPFSSSAQANMRLVKELVFRLSRSGPNTEEMSSRLATNALNPALRQLLFHAASGQVSWSDDQIADVGSAVASLSRIMLASDTCGGVSGVARATCDPALARAWTRPS
jgi:hypothetical protein